MRVRDGRAIVVRVDEGGPAQDAGVRAGWLLEGIEGDDVAELLAAPEPAATLRPETAGYKTLLPRIGGEIVRQPVQMSSSSSSSRLSARMGTIAVRSRHSPPRASEQYLPLP